MKIKSRVLRLAVAILSAVSFAAFASTGAASASAAAAPKPSAPVFEVGGPAPAGAVRVEMTYVPPKAAAGHLAPDNTVYGNCGSAWFGLANLEAGQARASYGFEIDEPADAYFAYAVVSGAHVTKSYTQQGTLLNRTDWDGGFTATIGDGPAFGTVEMIAYLSDNKGACESLYPTGTAIIT
jgi:hypothetical protein